MNKLLLVFQNDQKRTSVAAQVLILLMMMCVNIISVMTASWMSANFISRGLILFGFLMTVEALFSCHIMHTMPVGDDRKPFYRLAEWIVILLVVKIFAEIRLGFDYLFQNIVSWPNSFSDSFFSTNFLFTALITLFLWLCTTLFISDLMKFDDDIMDIRGYPIISDYQPKSASASLRERFFAVGALIVFMAGIMRQSKIMLMGKTAASEIVVSLVIVYFLLGLVLLSLSHFSNLRASWGREQFTLYKNMSSSWITYFIIFLACLGLLVFFLPTNYSMGLFTTIRFVFNWLFIIIKFLLVLLLFPFFWIFNQISLLFGKPIQGPIVSSLPPQFQPPAPEENVNLPGWEIVKSVVFWLVFLAILIFAIRQYIQANRRLVETLRRLRITRWISETWAWITMQFRGAGHGISALLEAGANRLRQKRVLDDRPKRWKYINPNRMEPRQRIVFFYLSMLRRADEAGITRKTWETPLEFSRKLNLVLPEENESITILTNTFLNARYSPGLITSAQADKTRTIWVKLAGLLRRKSMWDKHK